MKFITQSLALLVLPCLTASAQEQPKPFVHPGLLHTQADLNRMRQRLSLIHI